MQTKDQILQSKRWRTVAGIAAAATLGLGTIAVASPGDDGGAPEGITLQEPGVVREVPMPDPMPPTTLVVLDDANDSPFDDAADPVETSDMDSPDMDSPDMDSPDMESPDMDSPDMDSPDMDSPDMDSPDLETPDDEDDDADDSPEMSDDADDDGDSPDDDED